MRSAEVTDRKSDYIQTLVPKGRLLADTLRGKDTTAFTRTPKHALVRERDIQYYQTMSHGEAGQEVEEIPLDFLLDGVMKDQYIPENVLFNKLVTNFGVPLFALPGIKGTENFVCVNAETIEDATFIVKAHRHPRDKAAVEQRALIQNFFANVAPDNIPAAEGFWFDETTNGIIMPVIQQHDLHTTAIKEAELGDNTLLNQLVNHSFEDIYHLCQRNGIPFDLEPLMRNFLIDPNRREWFIDEFRVEPEEIIATETQINITTRLFAEPGFTPDRKRAIMRIVRDLERLEQHKEKFDGSEEFPFNAEIIIFPGGKQPINSKFCAPTKEAS